MKRIRRILTDRRGASFPMIVAVTLTLVMIFAGIPNTCGCWIVAQGVRDAVQSAVISTVTENYDDVYHGVREGYSGAYQPVAEDFEESLDYGDVYSRLDAVLGLSRSGGYHRKLTEGGELEFRVWGLSVDIKNAPLAQGDSAAGRFIADCTIELEVPVSFGGALAASHAHHGKDQRRLHAEILVPQIMEPVLTFRVSW